MKDGVRCTRCGRVVPAVRNAAGIVVALPHPVKGDKPVFGENCGAKR